jgi:hypothetical protein
MVYDDNEKLHDNSRSYDSTKGKDKKAIFTLSHAKGTKYPLSLPF